MKINLESRSLDVGISRCGRMPGRGGGARSGIIKWKNEWTTILNECVEGEEVAKRREEKNEKGVGEGWLKREATKLKAIPRGCRTAGDKLSSKKRNFGIAPVCMPFEPFIVWDSLESRPCSFIHFLCRWRGLVPIVMSKVGLSHVHF